MFAVAFLTAAFLSSAAPTGQIAFVAGAQQASQCVCVMDVASGATTRVGPGKNDGAPVWSPDGERLAFETLSPTGLGIYVVRADGSEGRLLNTSCHWNRLPRWSPDGTHLAYAAESDEPNDRRIMVYDLAANTEARWGGNEVRLVRPVWLPTIRLLYALKPDEEIQWGNTKVKMEDLQTILTPGTVMVAMGLNGGEAKPQEKAGKTKSKSGEASSASLSTDVFIVTADMATPLPILPSKGHYTEWMVEVSRKGESLAFESNDGGDREIFVLNKKGATDVTNNKADDWNPTWSWNGDWIAFESFRDGRRGIYRVYPETAHVIPVAVTPDADNWWPAWAPNDKWIAFVSTRTGLPQLFVTDLSGKTRQLTSDGDTHLAPAWRPKAKGKK